MKHETSDRVGQLLTLQKSGSSDFFLAPAVHQRAEAVIARTTVLTQRAKGANVWANFETKDIGAGSKGRSDCQ